MKKTFILLKNISQNHNLYKLYETKSLYQWLIGFTDGNGSLNISVSQLGNVKIRLNYHLHKDDAQSLIFIKNLLRSKSSLEFRKNTQSVSFGITNQSFLKEIIIPIFDEFPFASRKFYSYMLWKNAFLEYEITKNKNLLKERGKKLTILKNKI